MWIWSYQLVSLLVHFVTCSQCSSLTVVELRVSAGEAPPFRPSAGGSRTHALRFATKARAHVAVRRAQEALEPACACWSVCVRETRTHRQGGSPLSTRRFTHTSTGRARALASSCFAGRCASDNRREGCGRRRRLPLTGRWSVSVGSWRWPWRCWCGWERWFTCWSWAGGGCRSSGPEPREQAQEVEGRRPTRWATPERVRCPHLSWVCADSGFNERRLLEFDSAAGWMWKNVSAKVNSSFWWWWTSLCTKVYRYDRKQQPSLTNPVLFFTLLNLFLSKCHLTDIK